MPTPKIKKPKTPEVTKRFIEAMDSIIGPGVNKGDFADQVGVTRPNLQSMRVRGRYVTVEAIVNICEIYKVSPEWLITGKGSMRKETTPALDKRLKAIEEKLGLKIKAKRH